MSLLEHTMMDAIRLPGMAILLLSVGALPHIESVAEARPPKANRTRSPAARLLARKLNPSSVARRASATRVPTTSQAAANALSAPPLLRLTLSPSYYDEHALRVRHDLMFFSPFVTGSEPLIENGQSANEPAEHGVGSASGESNLQFAPPLTVEDPVAAARGLDRLMLFREQPTRQFDGIATGVGLFAASSLAAAHGPRRLRLLFDGPVHLGPAIFQGGGMGAGVGGKVF